MDGIPFGRYRLIELVGRGGMGEVWRAHDSSTDRVVALKVLPSHLADDEMFQQRFRREARAAAGLEEPHVVPIYDFGEIDGRLYVSMRLINGHDLETLLKSGPLEPARAVRIIEQIASALHAAHRIGLVHRDVKPSNMLIAEDDFAYLIDFGIARAAGQTGLTSTGVTVGTWAYMAPERFRAGTVDPRVDVYALACVLYQALTGQQPFSGDSLEQLAAAHMFAIPPKPSERRADVPAAMDQVIATGMAKEPNDRYSTTKDLVRDANAALIPPATPTPTSPPQVPRTELAAGVGEPATHKYAVPAESPPAVASAYRMQSESGPAPIHWRPPDSSASSSQAAANQRASTDTGRRNLWVLVAIALGVLAVIAGVTVLLVYQGDRPLPSYTTTTTTTTTQDTPPTYLPPASPRPTRTQPSEPPPPPNYGSR